MPLKERAYSVLVISAAEKFNTSLSALMPEAVYSPVRVAGSVNAAQRDMQNRQYDIVIINSPLPDDFGRRFAIDACANHNCVALMLVKSELYGEIFEHVLDYGVFALRKPTSANMLLQALDWSRAARERLRKLEKRNMSLEDKMAEIRLVNHAKWALIESCKMTEEDAHKYIEKQAMDRCLTRREIAEGILRTYASKP